MTPITLSPTDGEYFNGILKSEIEVFCSYSLTVVKPLNLLMTLLLENVKCVRLTLHF